MGRFMRTCVLIAVIAKHFGRMSRINAYSLAQLGMSPVIFSPSRMCAVLCSNHHVGLSELDQGRSRPAYNPYTALLLMNRSRAGRDLITSASLHIHVINTEFERRAFGRDLLRLMTVSTAAVVRSRGRVVGCSAGT